MSVSSTHISQRPFCGTYANIASLDETQLNVAAVFFWSLLFKTFNLKLNKNENTSQQPFERKWTGPIDSGEEFH